MNVEKIKYVHIMSHLSFVYNAQIVYMINENDFHEDEHLFIISEPKVYETLKQYKNVIFVENISTDINELKKYADICKYIFLHSNTLPRKVLFKLNKNVLNKIIWCIWGHDLYQKDKPQKPKTVYRKIRRFFGNIKRFFPNYYEKKQIKQFYAMGIGFQYDAIEVKRKYGEEMKIIMAPYGYVKNNKQNIDKIINNEEKGENYKKIMVGHSAYEFLNHIKLLNQLAKYKDEDIKISLVLAYGIKEYAEKVKKEAIKIFGEEKVEIIDKMMSQQEYVQYLSTVDICLLDYKHQSALGNIYFLLYMGKKLFLNKDGIIKLFSTLENIETYNVEDIDKMDYAEFSREVKNPYYGKQFAEFHINDENYLEIWKKTLKELD